MRDENPSRNTKILNEPPKILTLSEFKEDTASKYKTHM
jgi:hypothetical protein